MKLFMKLALISTLFLIVNSRDHTANLKRDGRTMISLSSFGYLKKGYLSVNITSLYIEESRNRQENFKEIGFTLDKSGSSGTSAYTEREENSNGCILTKTDYEVKDVPRAIFTFVESQNKTVMEIKNENLENLSFFSTSSEWKDYTAPPPKHESIAKKDLEMNAFNNSSRVTRDVTTQALSSKILPVEIVTKNGMKVLSTSFFMPISSTEEEGYYELYFHNCRKNKDFALELNSNDLVSATVHTVEMNEDNFLSAGEIALPAIYGTMSCLFFVTGIFWFLVLCTNKDRVFTIHYLMGILMIVKALSIMFHAIDYYFIGKEGKPEAWAVIFYIVHLLKGILLFICLLLIGTGWAFIKYVLTDREKKAFMVVIPLQVIANIAYIIIEGTDKDSKLYYTWKDIMILVDLLCCGAILVPVIWSVRHLQEASQTDGKAAISLAKLRLFQHFYVMIICYLYFTRIIVYLLEITLPFQLIWIHRLFSEAGTFVFFVVTGYKFRPGCNNPYLSLSQDDSDDVESHALTESGLTETVSKVNQYEKDVLDTDENDHLIPLQRNRSSLV